MFTDMVGYTASVQSNEADALKLLREEEELVRPLFSVHQGREVKSTGDGFLVEFDSALRAVQCAIDIQQHLYERNSQPGVVPIQLRIGVHLGDVEERATDIFGDAVNIASRIEPLASPGGVCVSGEVFSQIRNKIPNKLEKIPPTGLKGVHVSIEIYRVILPWINQELSSETSGPTGIAILPFTNISPDPKDEYFADGLTEELITVLSQLRGLPVIARTSVMQYKSTTKAVSQIGTELGVSTLLEGSVRKAGNRLRITAQLIDAATQRHLWANSYDRELDDVFAVQTDIARQVSEALKIELRPAEAERLEARSAVSPDSYLAYLKGRSLQQDTSQAALESAKGQFELAISLDPNNSAAVAGLANVIRLLGVWYTELSRRDWAAESRRLVDRAIKLDPNLAEARYVLAALLWRDYEWDSAEEEFKLALSLDPSYARARCGYGQFLVTRGQPIEALREFTLAEAADPLWAQNLVLLAMLFIWLGRGGEALVKIRKLGEIAYAQYSYHDVLANYYLAQSDIDRCLQEIQRTEELAKEPRWKPIHRAWYYALSGEKEKARDLLRQEEKLPEFGQIPVSIAWIYAELGNLDECFRWLEKGLSSRDLGLVSARLDPRREDVRRDPRFHALLKKMNLA